MRSGRLSIAAQYALFDHPRDIQASVLKRIVYTRYSTLGTVWIIAIRLMNAGNRSVEQILRVVANETFRCSATAAVPSLNNVFTAVSSID